MKTYKWEGPGALSHAGIIVKQGEVIPSEIAEKLGASSGGQKTTTFNDLIKEKKVSFVVTEEPAPAPTRSPAPAPAPAPAPTQRALSEFTDEEVTALSMDELCKFNKPELQTKAESIGHKTIAGDNKSDFAKAIFDHYNQV